MVDSTTSIVIEEAEEQRKRKRQDSPESERDFPSLLMDRISAMPDSLLSHLLSFLPLKEAVATSVLARRWRFLWTHVHRLDFAFQRYSPTPLSDIVTRVLVLLQARSLSLFRISLDSISNTLFDLWMTLVVSRNVQVLCIYNYSSTCRLWPHYLFTCQTVVDMELRGQASVPTISSASLPNLKKLELNGVKYHDNTSFSVLISGCLVLEELLVKRSSVDGMSSCHICSSTLKKLVLENSFSLCVVDGVRPTHSLMIDTPLLQFLNLEDKVYMDVSAGNLSSLVEADVSLDVSFETDEVQYGQCIPNFIEKLHTVKFLRLKCRFITFPKSFFSANGVCFNNLTKLDLQADWLFVSKFLESADNLECLVLLGVDGSLKRWKKPRHVPTSMCSLKNVEINEFDGEFCELQMVGYLLQNAKVMKQMRIEYGYHLDIDSKLDMLEEILLFRRASEACTVRFSLSL